MGCAHRPSQRDPRGIPASPARRGLPQGGPRQSQLIMTPSTSPLKGKDLYKLSWEESAGRGLWLGRTLPGTLALPCALEPTPHPRVLAAFLRPLWPLNCLHGRP